MSIIILNMIKTKRGQLQTMETIAVLFVFFILLAIALIFYVGFKNAEAEDTLQHQRWLHSGELAQTVLNLQELQKSKTGTLGLPSLDVYRIVALSNLLDPNNPEADSKIQLLYNSKLGSARIQVTQIYPDQKNWTIYDRTVEDAKTVRPFFIPISLYYPKSVDAPIGTYAFGILEVWYYE